MPKTDLAQGTLAGVYVEAVDPAGQVLGQAVFLDWHRRFLPVLGDRLTCALSQPTASARVTITGQVVARHFEVQEQAGESALWVRLTIRVGPGSATRKVEFSIN